MSSTEAQTPRPVLFPRAAIELCRMSALTLMATFGLSIIFLAAAILLAPGSLSSALAVQPAPAFEIGEPQTGPLYDAQGREVRYVAELGRK